MKFSSLLLLSVFVSATFVSCKKSGNDPSSPVSPVVPDTLSAGWTKTKAFTAGFSDVVFQDANTGYALGAGTGGSVKSTDGGLTWSRLTMSGYNMSITPDGKLFSVGNSDTVYQTTNGGASFVGIKTNTPSALSDVYALNNTTAFASCGNGLAQTIDGGATWTNVTPVTGLLLFGVYSSCFFVNNTTGWMTSGSYVFKSNGSVNSWTQATVTGLPISPSDGVSIYATSASTVYIGSTVNRTVFKSTNGGLNFSAMYQFPNQNNISYLDLHFVDPNTGYACLGSEIYKTTDAGISWLRVVKLGTGNVVELHFIDANHGWACASDGNILRYKP